MILAGDIGGTKVSLTFFEVDDGRLVARSTGTYPSREHSSLREIVRTFVTAHNLKVDYACFGVAGPIRNGQVQLTNLPWVINSDQLNGALGFKKVFLLNDLQANAYGIAGLAQSDLVELNRGSETDGRNIVIISAGTGLGEGCLFWDGHRHLAIPSEGGHGDFSPRTDLDLELLRYLRGRYGQVSWEHVLSGPGFYRLYQFLRDTGRGEEPAWLAEEFLRTDPSAAITRAGLEDKCDLCAQTLDLFVSYYGAEASNLTLKFLATGGVYVGGGIAPKMIRALTKGAFMKAFIGEGRMKDLLAAMRVRVIMNDKTALIGAARYAATQTGKMA
ncbi:MAG: glucokinase [Akkermansiaceae bacterium]|nr:glucokinase [Verrucomicrobiales bacterium]